MAGNPNPTFLRGVCTQLLVKNLPNNVVHRERNGEDTLERLPIVADKVDVVIPRRKQYRAVAYFRSKTT